MPKVQKQGAAAPESRDSKSAEVGHDIMQEAARLLGHPLPDETKPARQEPEGGEVDDDDKKVRKQPKAKAEGDDGPEAGAGEDGAQSGEDDDKGDGGDAGAGDGEDDDKGTDKADDDKGEEADDDDDDESPEAKALKEENAKLVGKKLKDLPDDVRERVQEVLDTRIGVIQARATERVTAAEAKATELASRVDELAVELDEEKERKGGGPIVVPGIDPLMMVSTEAEIDGRLSWIEEFEDWADRYREGYEGDGTDKDRSYTADQIRTRLREVRRERDKMLPQARENLKKRLEHDAALRKSNPEIFDPKTPEYAARQKLFRLMPELKRFHNANTLALQFIAGDKALTAAAAEKAKKPGDKTKPPPKKAPRAPGSGGAAKGSVVVHQKDTPATDAAVANYAKTKTSDALLRAAASFLS